MGKLNYSQLLDLTILLSVERIGPAKVRSLIAKFKTIPNILNAGIPDLIKVDGISYELAKRIKAANKNKPELEEKFNSDMEVLEKIDGRIISLWDDDYPTLLKKIYDPPILFYAKGDFKESDKFCIAIIGTRQPTSYGKKQAEYFSSELSRQGITIVSGLARGIDSIAHSSSLKAGGRTIAVVGSGLDVIYPPENKKLFNLIAENGVIVSEFSPGTKPDAMNFPRRNRIISGLSLGSLIVETGVTGGAMQTAAMSLDQNREVFAVPGNLGVKQSEGTNLLIQKGEAKLVRIPDDILNELELKLKPIVGKNIPKPKVEMNLFEEKIFQKFGDEPLHIDKIASLTELTTSDCLVHLLSLEFKGLVNQLPGKVFEKR